MISLVSLRSPQERSLPDLLPYALLAAEGILLNKDGSLTASWSYRPPDDAGMGAAERNTLNQRLNRAFRGLGTGWCLQANAMRRSCRVYPTAAASHFPDPVSAAIDQERREYFEEAGRSFESFTALSLTWMPPAVRRLEGLFLSGEEGGGAPGDASLEQFRRSIGEFEDSLSVAVPCRRLAIRREGGIEYDEQLELIEECVSGERRRVRLPDCGMYADSYVGNYPLITGTVPKVGDRCVAVVHIAGFPGATRAGLLNPLLDMGIGFRWSTRFIPLDPWQAQREIRAYTRKWSQQVSGLVAPLAGRERGSVNRHALDMKRDGEEAESEAESGEVAFGYLTGNVVLMEEDPGRLSRQAHEVRKAILSLGLGARIEDFNAVEAWLGSLPGNSWANVRRPLVHSLNLADLCPTSSVYAGAASCPSGKFPAGSPPLAILITGGSTPFRLNLHVSDVGHTLIFGPTGSGKSTLLAFLAAQMLRYPRARIHAFDKGLSLYALNQAVGGRHYRVGEGGPALAPLSRIHGDREMEWCVDWVEGLVRLSGRAPTGPEREEIRRALGTHARSGHPSLGDFIVQVQSLELKAALGTFASLPIYNGSEDFLGGDGAAFDCFEIGELLELPEEKSLPLLLYIFHRIERGLDGAPTFLLVDEAWTVLGHEVFRERLLEWLRTLRKANAAVVLATQSLSDASRSGLLDVLLEACPTRIFLPNPAAVLEEGSRHYRSMGLGPAQRQIVAEARPRREYFVASPLGSRLVDLGLGPAARAFCTAGSPSEIRALEEERRRSGPRWPWAWIERHAAALLALLAPLAPAGAQELFGPAPPGPRWRVEEAEEEGRWSMRLDIPAHRRLGAGSPEYWAVPEGGVIHRDLLWDERALCRRAGIPFAVRSWSGSHLALGHAADPATLIDARPVESVPAGRKYDDPWRAVTRHDQTLAGKLWALLRHQPGYRAALPGLDLEERGGRILPRTLVLPPIVGRLRPGTPYGGTGFEGLELDPADREALIEAEAQGMILEYRRSGRTVEVRRSAHVRSRRNEPVSLFLALHRLQEERPAFHRWRYDQQAELSRAVAALPLVPNRNLEAVAAGREPAFVEVGTADYWEAVLRLGDRIAELGRSGELQRVAWSGPGGSQIRTTDFLTWLVSHPVRRQAPQGPSPGQVRREGAGADPASFLDWFERATAPVPGPPGEADAIRRMAEELASGSGRVPLGTMAVQAAMSVLMADYLGALFAFFGGRMTEATQARVEGHWIAMEFAERGLARQGRRNLEAMESLRALAEAAARPLPSLLRLQAPPAPGLRILPDQGSLRDRSLGLAAARARSGMEAAERLLHWQAAAEGLEAGARLAARQLDAELGGGRLRVLHHLRRAGIERRRLEQERRDRDLERLREREQDRTRSLREARLRLEEWRGERP